MKKEVINKIAALVTAAFGLVAALAWNDTIRAIFREVFGTPDKLSAMIVYSLVITIIAVIVTIWIGNIAEKAK